MTQPLSPPPLTTRPPGQPADRIRPAADQGGLVAGLVLIAIGVLVLVGQNVPDAGEYVVLALGLVLFALFLARREYGLLIPACILTGVGAGVPLATANPGDLGGGLVLICLGSGFLAIWAIGSLLALPGNHWWPLVPAVVLGSTGAALVAGERGRPIADAFGTLWPILLLVAGAALLGQALLRRPR